MPVPKWVVSSSTVRILQNRICYQPLVIWGHACRSTSPAFGQLSTQRGRLGGVGELRGPGQMSSGPVPKPVVFRDRRRYSFSTPICWGTLSLPQ